MTIRLSFTMYMHDKAAQHAIRYLQGYNYFCITVVVELSAELYVVLISTDVLCMLSLECNVMLSSLPCSQHRTPIHCEQTTLFFLACYSTVEYS